MNTAPLTRLVAFAAVLAAAAATAPAALAGDDGTPLTRHEVKQQTRAAMQAGQMVPAGEMSAPVHMTWSRSRDERKAETLAANRNGALATRYEGYTGKPADALAHSTKTRAERKAETMEAIRNHQIVRAGEAA
ncbi:MAG TPA: DUF4148 domain-containing protein [Burkholderiaceae bacterium]